MNRHTRRAVIMALILTLVAGCIRGERRILNQPPEPIRTDQETYRQHLEWVTNRLIEQFVDGRKVDYEGIRRSEAFGEYVRLVRQLPGFDLTTLNTTEKQLAFWINLYNTLVIHAVLEENPKTSVRDKPGFFNRYGYVIHGKAFTLNDIEHGILRGERIGADDPRFPFVVARLDPRLHAALNCASYSCPFIRGYTADRIEEQLNDASREFVSNPENVRLDPARKTLHLSKIFEWYRDDFGFSATSVKEFVLEHLPEGETKSFLHANLESAKESFNPYDWSLNNRP